MAHEVALTAAEKPVVVSMVDVAGSGGYYIAYKATKMLADPLTRTGSIGSINGFFNLKGFYDKIGLSKDFVSKGPMARLGTDYRDPTDEEWDRHVDAHWKNFNSWLADVARHRGMTFAHAESLAHGRVFTGRQAAENGLIDGLGNLDDAVQMAAELAGIDPETPLKVVHLPEKQSLLQMLVDSGDEDGPVATALRWYVYRTARQDLQETARFLNSSNLAVMP
jgi:protease-4